MAVAVASAGELSWLSGQTELFKGLGFLKDQQEITDHVLKGLTEAGVRTHINYAINGGSYTHQLEEGLITGAVDSIAGFLMHTIGDIKRDGLIDKVSHKVFHATVGALHGAALEGDALAGAIGAAVGQTVAEIAGNHYEQERKDLRSQQESDLAQATSSAKASDIRDTYKIRLESLNRYCADIGKYAALAASLLAHCDPHATLAAATIAIEEDFTRRQRLETQDLRYPSGIDPFKSAIENYHNINGNTVKDKVESALSALGASENDIAVIMNDDTIQRTLTDCQDFENKRWGKISIVGSGIIEETQTQSQSKLNKEKFLKQGLEILTKAATGFNYLADEYPTLVTMTLTALQVATAGPAGYLRDKALEATGVQGHVDRVVEATESWASDQLQATLDIDKSYADVLSKGGGFGLGIGLSVVGAVDKSKVIKKAEDVAEKVKSYIEKKTSKQLLPGEGRVGTFKELDKIGRKGDNLTPNHVPQAAFMKEHGVSRQDGICIMMEHPTPGSGGRHRFTRTYGQSPDLSASPRVELARDIMDLRSIYRNEDLHTPEIRRSLQEVIEKNKQAFPNLFNKK